MKTIIFIFSIILLLSLNLVSAHGEETFAQAEEIIESKISCDQLTDEQLETVGDYYMEQMHPGETHETMDEIMGGEGSESLRQMHVNIARSFYCGEHEMMGSGMMDMIMGRTDAGMMSSGMIDFKDTLGGNKMVFGMMGDTAGMGMIGGGLLGILWFAIAAFVFSIIFWLTYNWLVKGKK